jgi:hypothetical protein
MSVECVKALIGYSRGFSRDCSRDADAIRSTSSSSIRGQSGPRSSDDHVQAVHTAGYPTPLPPLASVHAAVLRGPIQAVREVAPRQHWAGRYPLDPAHIQCTEGVFNQRRSRLGHISSSPMLAVQAKACLDATGLLVWMKETV